MSYLYCISSDHTDRSGNKKLGMTMYPIQRMHVYNTGDCPGIGLEKRYNALWQVNAQSKAELFGIERNLHAHFQTQQIKNANGNNSEWFHVSLEEIVSFLAEQSYVIRMLTIEEIEEIHTKAKVPPSEKEIKQCMEEIDYIKENVINHTLKTKFFDIFLPGKVPRTIQSELWDRFEQICLSELTEIYKGIVQWPTGTGKTIAILLLIVLAKEYCVRHKTIYRGLLVTPKNDIFRTISSEFHKLSEFGITLYDGSHGKFSRLSIPSNAHILIMACPDSLRNEEHGMRSLPDITHVLYDEVHRITGNIYFTLLQEMLVIWKTQFLTGTSATPKTSSSEQHRKFAELFGDPYPILHKCDVDEAVRNKWIATPRFVINITSKQENPDIYNKAIVDALITTIQKKKESGSWKGGKCIVYTSSITSAKACSIIASELIPEAGIYLAIDGERSDKEFVESSIDGTIRILFACNRYREGSDINGIEMTAVMIGNTISAYILIQIQGRSLRIDYANKEGWCLIVASCEEDETEQDVLDRIALDILSYLGEHSLTKKDIRKIIDTYFADVLLNGKVCSKEETIERIQAAYIRKEYQKRTYKEKYEVIRALNKEMGLSSKTEYEERYMDHPNYISDPRQYFKDYWISWYHFLGIDTTVFPQTKQEWICLCKELKLITWDLYKEYSALQLPREPSQMYEDYTNWTNEFNIRKPLMMRRQ
jgi:superfamily II DNA or RNA helicase